MSNKRAEVSRRLRRGESLRSIAKSFGIDYQTLQYHRRRWGCRPLRAARTSGEAHASWKGGAFVDRFGYRMVRAPQRKTANPYTPEHILVVERRLGRRLRRGEVVHHISGDKADNDPENLLVCTRSRHRELHRQLEVIGYALFKRGVIRFDGTAYVLIHAPTHVRAVRLGAGTGSGRRTHSAAG